MKNRSRQINIQVGDELAEDIKVVSHRRGMTQSEFIRRIITEELEREAERQVVFAK